MEKFEFCRIHDAEALVVPMGIREDYPMHIDFSKLDERVSAMEAELRGIIERSVRSPYLERALKNYERMGTLGARRPHVVLANVDQTLVRRKKLFSDPARKIASSKREKKMGD